MGFPTQFFLAVGDGLAASGNDYVPSSGDYLNLSSAPAGISIGKAALELLPFPKLSQPKTAGAVTRMRSARALPTRTIKLHLQLIGDGTDANSPLALWRAIEHKLEQARIAAGAMGRGTGVVLLCRLATSNSSSLGTGFTAFDVLTGELSYEDLQTNPGQAIGALLELTCLPYGRLGATYWPSSTTFSASKTNDTNAQQFLGSYGPGLYAGYGPTLHARGDLQDGGASVAAPLGAWDLTAGYNPGTLYPNDPAPSQFSLSVSAASYSGTKKILIAQHVSPAFTTAQTLAAANWPIADNLWCNFAPYQPMAALYLVNAAGALKATIVALQAVGASHTVASQQYTMQATVTGGSASIAPGDCLVYEIGISLTSPGGAVSASSSTGSGTITADNTASGGQRDAVVSLPAALSLAAAGIPGHVGALAQIHIKDLSTGGHAINRIRIGRLATGGTSAAPADWSPVVNTTTTLGGASLTTSDPAAVGGDWCGQALTDSTWHDLARFASNGGSGSVPAYEPGQYDVWCRVKETGSIGADITITGISTSTLGTGIGLVPDSYNVCVATNDGTHVGRTSTIATITTQYLGVWPPNTLYDGFETGDTSNGIEITDTSHGQGALTVSPAAVIAGLYGLRSQVSGVFPQDYASTWYTGPAQEYRRPIVLPNLTDPVGFGFWFQATGGLDAPNTIYLAGIGSNNLQFGNPPATGTTGLTGAPTATGDMQGLVAALIMQNNQLKILTWTGTHSYGATAVLSGGNPVTAQQLAGRRVYVQMIVGSPSIPLNTAVNLTVNFWTDGLVISAFVGAFNLGATATAILDYVTVGARLYGGAGSADIHYDDINVHQSNSGAYPFPGQSFIVSSSDGGANRNVYVQRLGDNWHQITQPAQATAFGNPAVFGGNPVTPPAMPVPAASQFRGKFSIGGTAANPIYTAPVPTILQGGNWHLINLGTLNLPPMSQFEGLNPAGGTGSGAFPWQLDIQGQSGAGATSNTLGVDALWLLPHDEPQVVAEFPGLSNTTPMEWVIDARRDGRVGCILRDAATQTTILGSVNVLGHMELGVGNQWLVFIVEREGGVHDVANTLFAVQIRYQQKTEFLNDNPGVF